MMKSLENHPKWSEIQNTLKKYPYLSKNSLPGSLDGRVFQLLSNFKRYPDRMLYPNFYHWYIVVKPFSTNAIQRWIDLNLYENLEDAQLFQSIKLNFSPKSTKKPQSKNQISTNLIGLDGDIENIVENSAGKATTVVDPQEIEYIIDIIAKNDEEKLINSLQKKITQSGIALAGDIIFRDNKVLRVTYKANEQESMALQDKILKWPEVENLLSKKDKKFKTVSSFSQENH